MLKIKLFCLPCAGASANMYRGWGNMLGNGFDVVLVELSGRGSRFSEPLYRNFEEAVEDIYSIIVPQIEDSPIALWGYSMGANLCYELACKLETRKGVCLKHVFLGACDPPGYNERIWFSNLDYYTLKNVIIDMGGIPTELLSHPDAINLYMKIIKSDLFINEKYVLKGKAYKVNCNVTILYGKGDPYTHKDKLLKWSDLFSGTCTFREFSGKHFFIYNNIKEIYSLIRRQCI